VQDQNDVLATPRPSSAWGGPIADQRVSQFRASVLGRSAQIIAARSKSARALYPPTFANLTCPLSRRRSRGRERHRAINDQREGRASDIIEDTCPRSTPTCRRSWPTLEALASRPNAGNSAIIWATNRWSSCRRWLFLKMLAYRLQTATCGDIGKVTRRIMCQEGLQLGIRLLDRVHVRAVAQQISQFTSGIRSRVSQCGIGLRCSIAFTRESSATGCPDKDAVTGLDDLGGRLRRLQLA
jgi:hypothetical protein